MSDKHGAPHSSSKPAPFSFHPFSSPLPSFLPLLLLTPPPCPLSHTLDFLTLPAPLLHTHAGTFLALKPLAHILHTFTNSTPPHFSFTYTHAQTFLRPPPLLLLLITPNSQPYVLPTTPSVIKRKTACQHQPDLFHAFVSPLSHPPMRYIKKKNHIHSTTTAVSFHCGDKRKQQQHINT